MGMLSSVMQGAAQGLNVLGQGMLKDIDRQQDQGIWEKRQALLAEIQRESAKTQRTDARDFSVAPETLAAQDTVATAAGATARKVKTAELTDEGLNTAARAKMAGDSAASADASRAAAKAEAGDTELTAAIVARENAMLKGTMAAKAKAAGMLASAADLGGGIRAKQAELLSMDIADKKRMGKLYDDYLAVTKDSALSDEQKAAKLKPISNAISALKAKNGIGSQRDPELDTQTVTEVRMNADGTTTKTTRKEVRKAGQGGAEQAPYADGTELRGKDGNVYVVKGGVPVLKGAGAAPTTPPARRQAARGPEVETTTTPDGKTVYRYTGQKQWFGSKVDALNALGEPRTSNPGSSEGSY